MSQRIEAVVHRRKRIRIRYSLCVKTSVVDTEAERTVLLGHEHYGACSFASCGLDNPGLEHIRDLFGLYVAASMTLAIRRLTYGCRTRSEFDTGLSCRYFA